MQSGDFKRFMNVDEGLGGYVLSSLMTLIAEELVLEGRKDRKKLASRDFTRGQDLFGDVEDPEEKIGQRIQKAAPLDPPQQGGRTIGQSCPVTPLSGYARHIETIKNYAKASPENFAQVLMFSPLSANTPFAKHWDNYQVLMMILTRFPNGPPGKEKEGWTPQNLSHAVDSFGEKRHAMAHTIGGWKYQTISEIWTNRQTLYKELNGLAAAGDDVALIKRLTKLPGVQPVKAGFIVQLLWGRSGCIDTHNIDIYSKVFPDLELAGEFGDPTKRGVKDPWQIGKSASEKSRTAKVKKYTGLLDKLQSRGIGTQQLWDVWVDFVESMYIMITKHGMGYYDYQGGALDPSSPEYASMKGITIPKRGIGKDAGGVMVPLAKGRVGMGASATHLPMEPDEALKQFYKMYRLGQHGSPAARAVAFHRGPKGGPLDQTMGVEPSALRYFGPAVTGSDLEVDPEHVRRIIAQRMAQGGKKARKAEKEAEEAAWFKKVWGYDPTQS